MSSYRASGAGARPIPTKLRMLHGNPSHTKKKTRREPVTVSRIPPCPEWMGDYARTFWRYAAPMLAGMDVLTNEDRVALEAFCVAYGQWREALDVLVDEGSTYETRNLHGAVMHRARPEVGIADAAWAKIRIMLCEFGLTPSARTRIARNSEQNEEDDLQSFLKDGLSKSA